MVAFRGCLVARGRPPQQNFVGHTKIAIVWLGTSVWQSQKKSVTVFMPHFWRHRTRGGMDGNFSLEKQMFVILVGSTSI